MAWLLHGNAQDKHVDDEPLHLDKRYYIGPIKLGEGIRPRHVAAIAWIGLSSLLITNFFSLMQPSILAQRIHLPTALLGRTGGELALTQNMAVLIFTVIFGVIADRVRTNRFMSLAYIGLALSCIFYPLASSLPALMVIIFLLGMSQTITLTASQSHGLQYPDNDSRGKYVGMMSILNTAGLMLIATLIGPRLPALLEKWGVSADHSLRYAFWIFAAIVAPSALIAWYWLKQDPPVKRQGPISMMAELRVIRRNLMDVIRYAKTNKRFQLILIVSLFMRSDFAVVSTFLSLWVSAAGRAVGISTTAAVTHAGEMSSVILFAMLLATFFFGLLLDRINRVVLLLGALACVVAAYTTPLLVGDVFAKSAYICAALIGFAEGSIYIALGALIGQEAPAHLRGATIGIINLIAIIGVSIMNYTGGILFDKVSPVAPFLMIAVLNLCTLIWGITRLKDR